MRPRGFENSPPALALILVVSLVLPLRAEAGDTSGRRATSTRAYPGRSKVLRARERAIEEAAARRARELLRQAPPPPGAREDPMLDLPERPTFMLDNVAVEPEKVVFEDFETLRKARQASEGGQPTTGAPSGGKVPTPGPPRAPTGAPGASTVRSPVNALQDAYGDQLEDIARLQRETNIRRRVRELAESGRAPDEVTLVREVLQARGLSPPGTTEELSELGFEVPRSNLMAGDLLFFELPRAGRRSRHVAIFYGRGRFAYASREGIRLGDLDDPRWSQQLVSARRIP